MAISTHFHGKNAISNNFNRGPYTWLLMYTLLGEHTSILSTFIKLPFVIKIFVLSTFEWPFYTGFTVWQIHFFPNQLSFKILSNTVDCEGA